MLDLSESKKLLHERNLLHMGLADEVPRLVAEVERLRGKLQDCAQNEREPVMAFGHDQIQKRSRLFCRLHASG